MYIWYYMILRWYWALIVAKCNFDAASCAQGLHLGVSSWPLQALQKEMIKTTLEVQYPPLAQTATTRCDKATSCKIPRVKDKKHGLGKCWKLWSAFSFSDSTSVVAFAFAFAFAFGVPGSKEAQANFKISQVSWSMTPWLDDHQSLRCPPHGSLKDLQMSQLQRCPLELLASMLAAGCLEGSLRRLPHFLGVAETSGTPSGPKISNIAGIVAKGC